MKALVLKAYNQLVFEDFPEPQITSEEVIIQVKACGICGSDVHGMDGSTGRRIPPIIMGHEAAGVIIETGVNVQGWKAGDRVTFDSTIYPLDDWYSRKGLYNLSDNRMVLGVSCDDYRRHGAFAEYVAVPSHILYRIPDKVTYNEAAMVEPAAVALHAVNLTPVSCNDSALVVGTGIIGLFIIKILRAVGCGNIIAVDLEPARLELARKAGADMVFSPDVESLRGSILKATGYRGTDIAFEAVGISATIKIALDNLRKGGHLTLVGNLSRTAEIPLQSVVTRQLRLQGSCAICGEYAAVLDMIDRGILKMDAMLSAAAPLSEGANWFKRLYDKEPGLMKVVLNPA
jgi:2-desacetyl-2-hydroxyethyl bacteriochlorophyllide A dehydrogenase